MARLPRLCLPGIPQHIIQRGTNRQICFASQEDMSAYAYWLEESAQKNQVSIHAWVFMTNHVHLLVTPKIKVFTLTLNIPTRINPFSNSLFSRNNFFINRRINLYLIGLSANNMN